MFLVVNRWASLAWKGVNPGSLIQQRNLFTKRFLGITFFTEKREQLLVGERGERNDHRETILHILTENSKAPIEQSSERTFQLRMDMLELMYLAETQEHTIQVAKVLKNFLEAYQPWDDPTVLHRKSYLMRDFFGLCYDKECLEAASMIWNDKDLLAKVCFEDDGKLGSNYPSVSLMYFDMLYNIGMYDKVLEEVEALSEQVHQLTPWLWGIYMVSCMQLNTPESYRKAKAAYEGPCLELKDFGIVRNPFSLLTMKQVGVKESLKITDRGRKSAKRTNLIVHLHVLDEQPMKAMRVLEAFVGDSEENEEKMKTNKIIFTSDTIQKLTKAVKSRHDSTLNRRLANLFSKLDKIAQIVDCTIEEMIVVDVDEPKDMKYRRHKNLMRNKEALAQEEFKTYEERYGLRKKSRESSQ